MIILSITVNVKIMCVCICATDIDSHHLEPSTNSSSCPMDPNRLVCIALHGSNQQSTTLSIYAMFESGHSDPFFRLNVLQPLLCNVSHGG
ncbi:unnamed protein product [Heterobilharzia americana]|nr:unnamed protein product [Heterobilharzia americana]